MNPTNEERAVSAELSERAAGFFRSRISWRQLNTLVCYYRNEAWSGIIWLCPWYLLWLTQLPKKKKKKWEKNKLKWTDDGTEKYRRKIFWLLLNHGLKIGAKRGIKINVPPGNKTKQLVPTAQRQQQHTIICTVQCHMSLSLYTTTKAIIYVDRFCN